MNAAEPLRAPQGARAWTPSRGFVYEHSETAAAVEAGDSVHVVSRDGFLRGVSPTNRAPLRALLRIETDLAELVQRLGDLADSVAGLDAAEAGDKAEVLVRLRALTERVAALEAAT